MVLIIVYFCNQRCTLGCFVLHFLLLKDCVLHYFSVVCVTLLVIGLCVHDPEYKPCFMDRPLTIYSSCGFLLCHLYLYKVKKAVFYS